MKVIEIFESIQGEGSFLGMPAIFIRLGGCNLHCPFCDSQNSWGTQGIEMEIGDISTKVLEFKSEIVVITGGEPSLNEKDLYKLAHQLKQFGKKVHLETNGTNDVDHTYFDWIVCSPKQEARYRICSTADELKYVVTPQFDPKQDIRLEAFSAYGNGHIWLQPEGSDMRNMWKKSVEIIKEYPELRIGVQLHKLMEVQ